MISPHAQRKFRFGWLDALIIAIVLAIIAYFVYRVDSVLHYRWNWERVAQYLWRWDDERQRWVANLFIDGLMTTIRLSVWGIIAATIIGTVMGLCRISRKLFPRLLSRAYVELIRNIPPLVFMFIFYFFISGQIMPLLGVEDWARRADPGSLVVVEILFGSPKLLGNFVSGLICLAMFEGAYVTEIVRAGIQSIPRGQWEAAQSVGLTRLQVMRDVILPQAFRRVAPPLAGQLITLIKTSSIVSLISVQELTFLSSEVANTTGRSFEAWIIAAGMYLAICFALALGFSRLEQRFAEAQR
ncbi:MAG: amino acid ABC transporter permease [Alphaproteobacteria bacterium]|nr:amino acid ABC transporter permease [Alphaproteobacteria bacterium]